MHATVLGNFQKKKRLVKIGVICENPSGFSGVTARAGNGGFAGGGGTPLLLHQCMHARVLHSFHSTS